MNILELRGIILFICALLNLLLALFLWQRSKGRKDIFWLSITALISGLYAFNSGGVYFFWRPDSFASILWYRLTWVGVLMLPPFVLFTYYFTGKIEKIKLKALFLFLGAGLISYLALTTTFFLKSVHFKYPNISGIAGPLDLVGRLYIFVCIIIGLVNLLKEYFKNTGFKKLQIKYFIAGTIIYAIAGTIFTAIIPLFIGESAYYDLIAYFSLIWMGLTYYAIIKYRLMDIQIIIGRGLIYLFSFITVIVFAFSLIFLNNSLVNPVPTNVAWPLILIIGILIFQPIFRFFERFASRYFYYTFYSYQQVLAGLGRKLTRVLDLDKLSSLIVNTLMDTMKLDRTVVLLRETGNGGYQIQKNIGFKEENGISLVKDNFLTQYLEKTQTPLVYEEISLIIKDTTASEERKRLEKLRDNMKKIEAALCLPLLIEEKIIGMIVVGNKISRDPYSVQDLQLLTALSTQSSVAFQNARLYSQVQDLSQNLQGKVEEQTQELRKAYEELKVLDKAKSEFISMASHQLRTPLSAIKGYISMLVEGSYGQVPEKAREKLKNVFQSNERLIRIVNDLLNISKIELGKIEVEKSSVQLEELVQSSFEEMKIGAEKKGIKILFHKPKKPLPKIEIDQLKIRQVILNLIDNAIRYTQKGEIELKTEKIGSDIRLSVRDTGEGLTEKEQKEIFTGFVRGSAGINYFIEGAGLGLYVAKKLLELHHGKIWVESEGKGKGSTFFVELPVKNVSSNLSRTPK